MGVVTGYLYFNYVCLYLFICLYIYMCVFISEELKILQITKKKNCLSRHPYRLFRGRLAVFMQPNTVKSLFLGHYAVQDENVA